MYFFYFYEFQVLLFGFCIRFSYMCPRFELFECFPYSDLLSFVLHERFAFFYSNFKFSSCFSCMRYIAASVNFTFIIFICIYLFFFITLSIIFSFIFVISCNVTNEIGLHRCPMKINKYKHRTTSKLRLQHIRNWW